MDTSAGQADALAEEFAQFLVTRRQTVPITERTMQELYHVLEQVSTDVIRIIVLYLFLDYGRMREGDLIDVRDGLDMWYACKVMKIRLNTIHIRYQEWGAEYDEWIRMDSTRVAPFGHKNSFMTPLDDEATAEMARDQSRKFEAAHRMPGNNLRQKERGPYIACLRVMGFAPAAVDETMKIYRRARSIGEFLSFLRRRGYQPDYQARPKNRAHYARLMLAEAAAASPSPGTPTDTDTGTRSGTASAGQSD
jgi:hypothetical protein